MSFQSFLENVPIMNNPITFNNAKHYTFTCIQTLYRGMPMNF